MDIEQTMRFIPDMQARHEAAAQKHDKQIAENSRQIQASVGMIRQLVDVSLSLARHGEQTDRRIRELTEETDRRFRETDCKLHALIDTVDKITKRNGSRD